MTETTGFCTCTHTTKVHPVAECIEQAAARFERMKLDAITGVLTEHQPTSRSDGVLIRWECTCGFPVPREVGAHRRHVAEQIAAVTS